jgi:hypothetical protein
MHPCIDHLYSDRSIYIVPGNGTNIAKFSFILAQNEAIAEYGNVKKIYSYNRHSTAADYY